MSAWTDEAARAALRTCVARCADEAISPPGVTTYKEEESRRLFQDGRAVFLRNWSYVWRLVQAEGSPLPGQGGRAAMVGASAGPGGGTLGGWGLGVSRFSRSPGPGGRASSGTRRSLESQRALCAPTGYAPALRAAYEDPELRAANPFLADARCRCTSTRSRGRPSRATRSPPTSCSAT